MGAAGAPGRVLLPDQGAARARNRRGRRPVDRRVEGVLARMTLAEKVAQLGGAWFGRLRGEDDLDEEKLLAALGEGIGHITCIATDSFARMYSPSDGVSSSPRMDRSVVLPHPDGPSIATYSPGWISR